LQQFFFGHVMFLLKDQPNAARAEHFALRRGFLRRLTVVYLCSS
jgi:hypothetical protein